MLTLKRRRRRRVPPQRGRGAISGLFFCFAQSSISALVVSTGLHWSPRAASLTLVCRTVPATLSGQGFSILRTRYATADVARSPLTRQAIRLVARRCGKQAHLLAARFLGALCWSDSVVTMTHNRKSHVRGKLRRGVREWRRGG